MLHPSASLAFRSLLKQSAAGSGLSRPQPVISGLTPAAAAFHAALTAQDTPVFLIVPADVDVEQFVIDTRFFLGALQGLSDAAAERLVLPFPSQEVDPYRGLMPHLEVSSARARALLAMVAETGTMMPVGTTRSAASRWFTRNRCTRPLPSANGCR